MKSYILIFVQIITINTQFSQAAASFSTFASLKVNICFLLMSCTRSHCSLVLKQLIDMKDGKVRKWSLTWSRIFLLLQEQL